MHFSFCALKNEMEFHVYACVVFGPIATTAAFDFELASTRLLVKLTLKVISVLSLRVKFLKCEKPNLSLFPDRRDVQIFSECSQTSFQGKHLVGCVFVCVVEAWCSMCVRVLICAGQWEGSYTVSTVCSCLIRDTGL